MNWDCWNTIWGDIAMRRRCCGSAVELKETVLGPEHPDLAASLTNLGAVYVAEGRYADAEAALARALAIQSKTLGAEHPLTAGTMMQYARVLRATKRKSEAARMEAQARAIEVRNAQKSFTGYTVDVGALGK